VEDNEEQTECKRALEGSWGARPLGRFTVRINAKSRIYLGAQLIVPVLLRITQRHPYTLLLIDIEAA